MSTQKGRDWKPSDLYHAGKADASIKTAISALEKLSDALYDMDLPLPREKVFETRQWLKHLQNDIANFSDNGMQHFDEEVQS